MNYKVELVAQAFYEAAPGACLWDNEPADCKEQFREFARNVTNLVNEDVGVLLASENSSTEEHVGVIQAELSGAVYQKVGRTG